MIQKIDHIGFAVKDLDQAMDLYTRCLGLKLIHMETLEQAHVRIAFFPVGGVLVELLMPTSPEAGIAKFIATHGEGIHHIAYRVKDVNDALEELKRKGVKLTDEKGRPGGSDTLIAFLAPEGTNGVTTELVQRDRELE